MGLWLMKRKRQEANTSQSVCTGLMGGPYVQVEGTIALLSTGVTWTEIFEVVTHLQFEKEAREETKNCQEATAMISSKR